MKKFLATIMASIMVLTMSSISTDAKEKYEINSLEEILEISEKCSNSKERHKQKLDMNKVNPKAIKDYTNYLFEEVEDVSNSLEAVEMEVTETGTNNKREIKLSTGSTLVVEETMTFENNNEKNAKGVINVPTGNCSGKFRFYI